MVKLFDGRFTYGLAGILGLALLCSPVRAATAPATTGPYAEGDAAFKKRGNPEEAWHALSLYRGMLRKNPGDAQAGWRVAMGCYFVGMRLEKDKEAQKGLYEEGRNAGFNAAEVDPGCAACHFWGAINEALYGDAVGAFKMLFSLKDIKKHLNASIQIDPAYAYAGADRLLGLIDQKLPGILGGSNKEARKWFDKAIVAAPDEPLNYLFMAKLLHHEFKDTAGAVAYLDRALAQPTPSEDRLESRESLAEIRKLRAEWSQGKPEGKGRG